GAIGGVAIGTAATMKPDTTRAISATPALVHITVARITAASRLTAIRAPIGDTIATSAGAASGLRRVTTSAGRRRQTPEFTFRRITNLRSCLRRAGRELRARP